jgi:hypothetical protein
MVTTISIHLPISPVEISVKHRFDTKGGLLVAIVAAEAKARGP